MASRTSNAKGHDLLLKAYVKVLKEFKDLNLVFCGDIDCEDIEGIKVISKINNIVEKNEIREHVKFLGCIPNDLLPYFYRKAELYVLPARFEPFGMAALEAMACQVPAVISKFAGIRENLTNGKDYMKVDPYNTEEFAATLIHLLKNKKLRNKLAERGRETVINNFSWEAVAHRFIAFYEQNV